MRRFIFLFSFISILSFSAFTQNAFWSNTGLVSLKPGAYLSIVGDAYNSDSGYYDNNDSIFLTGNWSHTAPNRCFDSIGAGWVYLYADTQHIKGTSITHFYNLILQNQGVKYGDLDVYVDGHLQLTDREFSMDTNTVWVLNPDTGSVQRTAGYVSSLNDGGLLRRVDTTAPYLFPVGSNIGTFRYRPVEFDPLNNNINHYKVRFANFDPSTEGFNRNLKELRVCEVNPVWYHRMYHVSGNDSSAITIMYDTTADGSWNDIVHWQNLPEWERIFRDTVIAGTPFNRISKFVWNNYHYAPFALAITSQLTIIPNIANVTCNGLGNGSISLTITNAQSAYTIAWSNGDTTATINNLIPGTYIVTISEVDHCAFSDTFTITQPPILRAATLDTNVTCHGGSNGSIYINPDGGTPPYQYSWTNGATTQNITGLDTGTYTVILSDSNHCQLTDTFIITQPTAVTTQIAVSNVTCYGDQNGSLNVSPSGGTPPYSYHWSNGGITAGITGLSGGTYIVTVTEADHCITMDTFHINEPAPLRADISTKNVKCYNAQNGSISVVPTGGTLPYSYDWSNGATTQNLDNLGNGGYTLVLTDSNGCKLTDSLTISQPPRDQYAVAGVDTIIWRSDTIQLNGFLGVNYDWSPAYNLSCTNCSDPYAWPDSDITYHLTIGDSIGCFSYDSVKVYVRDKPFPLFFIPNVITPNGDGFNDVWYIRDLEGYPDNDMRIVNRWGDEVFQQSPYQNNWAGTWRGQDLPGGTYYYILIIHNNGQDQKFDGPITIVR